jgi:hypothetical protein
MKLTLPPESLGATHKLLAQVFGTHRVPTLHPSAEHMEATLLGVDYVKLLLAGNQRLPVLTLLGPAPTLFFWWLQEVVSVPVSHVKGTDLHGLLMSSERRGLVVVDGPLSPEAMRLLDVLLCNDQITLSPPVEPEERRVVITARYALSTTDLPDNTVDLDAPLWFRPMEAEPAVSREELQREFRQLLPLMYHKPFLTPCTTRWWFADTLLAQPETA